MKNNELQGLKFGKLTTTEIYDKDKYGHIRYLCICDCGNTSIKRASDLKRGIAKSCGCMQKSNIKPQTKHGKRNTKLYRSIWSSMKRRCLSPNDQHYPNYGGRGVKICDAWLDDFMNFYNWAMENGYKEGLTIDRIDVNGNYEPSNCRWVTRLEQNNNRRNTIKIDINNNQYTIKELSDITGMDKNYIRRTYKKQGEDGIAKLIESHTNKDNFAKI